MHKIYGEHTFLSVRCLQPARVVMKIACTSTFRPTIHGLLQHNSCHIAVNQNDGFTQFRAVIEPQKEASDASEYRIQKAPVCDHIVRQVMDF